MARWAFFLNHLPTSLLILSTIKVVHHIWRKGERIARMYSSRCFLSDLLIVPSAYLPSCILFIGQSSHPSILSPIQSSRSQSMTSHNRMRGHSHGPTTASHRIRRGSCHTIVLGHGLSNPSALSMKHSGGLSK